MCITELSLDKNRMQYDLLATCDGIKICDENNMSQLIFCVLSIQLQCIGTKQSK